MTTTSISPPTFNSGFWQAYVPVRQTRDATEPASETIAPRLSYSAQAHGNHADFRQSKDFEPYKKQVRENLSFIAAFCREHQMPDAKDIERDFDLFFSHRFHEDHFFDTRAEIVDSIGKQSLDEFCSMIRNEAIATDVKQAAIRSLAIGVTLCADGAVSNLVCAAATLAKAAGGIRGTLWELKEQTARNVLLETVEAHFGHQDLYRQNEIHYVHTAWNALADEFGLQKNPDSIKMAEVTDAAGFMPLCAARVRAALRPDRLARLIAETCHAQFSVQMASAPDAARGTWDEDAQEKAAAALEKIGDDIGFTSEDTLGFNAEGTPRQLKESDLRLKSFIKLEEGDRPGTYTYTVRTDPSLIALDVLRTMDNLNLLQEGNAPQNKGSWIENGTRTAILVYGDLALLARTSPSETFTGPVWRNTRAELEVLAFPDILRWQAGRDNAQAFPRPAIIRQAIRNTKADQLMTVPMQWLLDPDSVEQFLVCLGPEKGKHYLSLHAASVGAGFSDEEREELLIRIMRLGMGEAVLPLARRWFPNYQECLDRVYSVLSREAIPALHRAMTHREPAAAVNDWYQPLRRSGLLTFVAPRLAELLNTHYIGWSIVSDGTAPILSHAVSNGRAAAIAAFYAVLKDLLKHPVIQPHITDHLPELLAATDIRGIPALSKAMKDGRTETVKAYYAGLDDLLKDGSIARCVRLALSKVLPDLLAGKKAGGGSGVARLLKYGHGEIFKILHGQVKSLLDDADIAPLLAPGLPDLLDSKDEWGTPGLFLALGNGQAEAIDAFHDLLKDLLKEPGIGLSLQGRLPELLAAKDSDGTPGLSYARRNGHTAAMTAFKAILFDPQIRPLIQDDLPRLMFVEIAQSGPPSRIFPPR